MYKLCFLPGIPVYERWIKSDLNIHESSDNIIGLKFSTAYVVYRQQLIHSLFYKKMESYYYFL